jgi:Protein of unknown function (DUF1592)/Protein of unknown function (DUF1588)/Protein of unknown function (DUF1585)/Protein of unknown function (DUF1595)/Protein of unknown function (DUF1587)/Planctomycete cytochrome C
MNRLLPLLLILTSVANAWAVDGEQPVRDFIAKHCLNCHSSTKHKGDVDLEKLPTTDVDFLEVWENARNALAAQEMPPPEKPQPSTAERDAVIAWIDRLLDGPGGDTPTDPGWVTVHRLTRTEFNRTIKDLIGVDGNPADAFPADSAGGSGAFDNQSDTLYVSPILMERLLEVSLSVIERAKPERLGIVAPEKDKKGAITPVMQRKAAELSLTAFLPRAWRRPVPKAEVQTLLKVYDRAAKKNNVTHDDSLRLTYAAALTSPNFIFRVEQGKPGTEPYALGPYDIANRLSYFLWSTMPDEALFKAAEDGSLSKPEGIAAQVTRMLADPKAEILPRQFMGQWLGTDELASGLGPDPKLIKGYSTSLRSSMIAEPAVFMQRLLSANGALTDLIDCNYVYVNGELADHYGLSGARGDGFTKLTVDDGRRGGLITMAGVLAITSRPSRTSPVIRGKWILQELLSYPPPPPPPNVPPLPEAEDGKPNVGTLRQRLERHRADPNCNSCHQRIDPLGFGLENYDAIGRWRTRGDHGEGLDTVGTMPSGETFDGPKQLKALLKTRQERVMQTLIERMLTYALGRPIERFDRSTVRLIGKNLAADQYHAQTLIREVALSLPFRFKRNPTVAVAGTPAPATK